MLDLLY